MDQQPPNSDSHDAHDPTKPRRGHHRPLRGLNRPNSPETESDEMAPTVPRKRSTPEKPVQISEGTTPPNGAANDNAAFDPTVPRGGRVRQRISGGAQRINDDSKPDSDESTDEEEPTGTLPLPFDKRPILRPVAPATAADTAAANNAGTGFARYQLGNELGRGGMGIVRIAVDPAFRRELAIKVLLDTTDSLAVTQFIEEAQITGQLEHPNIVPVHELGSDSHDRPYLTMKRVQGKNLRDVIRESEMQRRPWRLDEPEMLTTFRKICEAMAYAHSRGVIHRDLKPENVMVGEFGEVLVMDWGLAKPHGAQDIRRVPVMTDRRAVPMPSRHARRDGDGVDAEFTIEGDVFGTPGYMAPEQARGDHENLDERADIFALGAILYALLACRAPYADKNVERILSLAREGKFEPADRVAAWRDVPKELSAIAAKAMAFNPADRYQTARELVDDIAHYQSYEPITARRDDPLTVAIKWARRHPRATLSGTLGLLFAVILSILAAQLHAAQTHAELADARADREAANREAEKIRADAEAANRIAAERETAHQTENARFAEAVARFQIGTSAALQGNYEKAIYEYNQSLEIMPEFAETYISLGNVKATMGKYLESIRDYDRAFEIKPELYQAVADDFMKLNFNYAVNLIHEKRPDVAIGYLNRVIELNPTFALAYAERGEAKYLLGDVAGARNDIDEAIRVDERLGIAYALRGVLRSDQKDFEGGISDIEKALSLDPELNQEKYARQFAIAYANRGGERTFNSRDFGGAIADLERAIQLAPDLANDREYKFNVLLANAYLGRGIDAKENFDAAIADVERALELANTRAMREQVNQHLSTVYVKRGNARFHASDQLGAIADLNKATEINSRNWQAWTNLAAIYRNTDPPKALQAFENAYRHCDNPRMKSQIADWIRQTGGTVPE